MFSALGDNMGGMGSFGVGSTGMGAVMKEFRQQPYPVDVISSQLYGRLSSMQGGVGGMQGSGGRQPNPNSQK